MPTDKQSLVAALEEIALLMELRGENAFRARAYEQAARALAALEGEPEDWLRSGVIERTRGIGKGMSEKVGEWVHSGHLALLEQLRREFPATLYGLLAIPGLGPKKVKVLYQTLGIQSLEALEAAAADGRLAEVPGFGAKTAEKILVGIRQRRQYAERHRVDETTVAAEAILARLGALAQVERIAVAGSLRRRRETIKDLDFLVTSRDPEPVMRAFVEAPGVAAVVAHGPTKSSVLLANGIPADLRVVAPEEFAAALVYFTGSKEHNTTLRGRAKRLGYKLNEYGLFPVSPGGAEAAAVALQDEAALYRQLGLAWIAPELREDRGEFEAAEGAGSGLPELIRDEDLRGVLHCHTTYSDGRLSVQELATACQAAGYRYLAICDHSQSAAYAHGLTPDDLRRQLDEIDAVSAQMPDFKIFKGIESDILADGALDYDDALLARLDLVVISVHSRFQLDRAAMTERIVRAIEHPAATILGHPTGRLLLRREPYEVDLERVFAAAAAHDVAIEINAHPARLDLDWRFIPAARAAGCRFAIDPDAHSLEDLALLRYGVGVARKGWLTAADVVNTREAAAFAQWLHGRRRA